MSLRSDATLEAFLDRIIHNKEIMDIMELPTIEENDDEKKYKIKRNIINKCITKSAQNQFSLTEKMPRVVIDDVIYDKYGKIRMTISLAASIKTNSDIFGNPQVDIYLYYDNTNMENTFKLLDLLSDEFSGKSLKVNAENDKFTIRELKNEGLTAQTSNINNYERVGLRFSFFATLYKNLK